MSKKKKKESNVVDFNKERQKYIEDKYINSDEYDLEPAVDDNFEIDMLTPEEVDELLLHYGLLEDHCYIIDEDILNQETVSFDLVLEEEESTEDCIVEEFSMDQNEFTLTLDFELDDDNE